MSDHTRSDALQSQYLTVNLAHEEYGIDILAVREIRGWTPVTRIPQSPHYVLGVLNLRGAIVPVIDMRLRFGLRREEYNATTVTVIITVAGRQFGVVVDAVSDVIDVASDAMRPVPDMGTTVDTEYLKGLTSDRRAHGAAARCGQAAATAGCADAGGRAERGRRCESRGLKEQDNEIALPEIQVYVALDPRPPDQCWSACFA